jgi:hypothetical protein
MHNLIPGPEDDTYKRVTGLFDPSGFIFKNTEALYRTLNPELYPENNVSIG